MVKSVLQDWVMELGLRHQGTLLTAIRGCDTAPKHDPSKLFTRCYRGVVLNAHCGDAKKAATFIEVCEPSVEQGRFQDFRRNCDHYPQHYFGHLLHAIEIVGYCHPNTDIGYRWTGYYIALCRVLHVTPESRYDLDARLNADEETFAKLDRV